MSTELRTHEIPESCGTIRETDVRKVGFWSGRLPGGLRPPEHAMRALVLAPVLALMAWYSASIRWQCDDAFISFRYVWHLVNGHGLVFNPGERVEGYTNFLWVLELAAVWRWLGVPPEVAADVLSAICTVVAVGCVIALAYRMPTGGIDSSGAARERAATARTFIAFGALLLLATSRTWAAWTTSGLETRQFTAFVLLGLYLVHTGRGRPGRLAAASLAFVGAEYTRPEGPLLWAFAGAWLLVEMGLARKFSWRDALAYGVPFVALVGAHYLWRHAYYGDWLPNTYYAKYVRPWPEAGVRYYASVALETGVWLLLPFAIVGAVARLRLGDRLHVLSALVVGAHVVYLVRVGGDHFEWRPLDFYWPLLAIAAVEGMLATASAAARWMERRRWGRASRLEVAAGLALLALGSFYGSVIQRAKADATASLTTRDETFTLIVQLDQRNAAGLFSVPLMGPIVRVYNELQDYCLRHGVGTVWREHEVFWRDELRKWSRYEVARGRQPLPPDAVTARGSIGIFGYYLADIVLIDLKGLTDRTVARQTSDRPNERRYMAHDRYASLEYLHSRGFNVLVEPAARTREEALNVAPFVLQLADDAWMPFNSRLPEWVDETFTGRPLWLWRTAREVGCFGDGLPPGWILEGDAFVDGLSQTALPTRTLLWPERCAMTRVLSTRDGGAARKGSARSPRFEARADTILELRLGGTHVDQVGARLVDVSGAILSTIMPIDESSLFPEHFDLSPFAGRELSLEIFDDSADGWVMATAIVVLQARRIADGD